MKIYKGTIKEFRGTWSSGIATLLIEDDKGVIKKIPCDNGPTVIALEACFGETIGESNGGYIGKQIYYSIADWGVLEGFIPVDDASEKVIEAYEKQEEL